METCNKKIYLSVVIITFNEEKRIEKCLQSVQLLADEIIVVDSFSTDKTHQICERYGAVAISGMKYIYIF